METTEKAFPFDSEEINGEPDRLYFAEDFMRYFAAFISSGVFMNTADELQVIANGDMTVTLRPGALISAGCRYDNTKNLTITLDPADGVLSRIDRIAIVWDKGQRDMHAEVRKGVASYDPVAPELRRNAEYLDYIVADIFVGAGVVSISQTDITDQRLNSEVCGLALPWATIDTTTLYKQIQSDLSEFRTVTQGSILAWFANIKDQLSGDVAVNLQNQIGTLAGLTTNAKNNIVDAINEVNEKEVDVLDTMEEIEANTTAGKVAGALAVKEFSNKLGGFTPLIDETTGQITGYKTSVGADTVFPFKTNEQKNIISIKTSTGSSSPYYGTTNINLGDVSNYAAITISSFKTSNSSYGTFRILVNGSVIGNYSKSFSTPATLDLTSYNSGDLVLRPSTGFSQNVTVGEIILKYR